MDQCCLASVPGRHAQLIRSFAHWYVFRRARKASDRRMYTHGASAAARNRITSAIAFLSWLDANNLDLATLSQGNLDQWLVSGEPHRREIRSFLAWATRRRLAPGLTVPQRSSRQMPAGMQKRGRPRPAAPAMPDRHGTAHRCQGRRSDCHPFGLPLPKIVQLTAEHLPNAKATCTSRWTSSPS